MTEQEPTRAEAAVQELDRLILEHQHTHVVQMAGARELKWILIFVLLMMPMIALAPFLFDAKAATAVAYQAAIAGAVVSTWGTICAYRARNRISNMTRMAYVLLFLLLIPIYVALFSSPHLGKSWTVAVPSMNTPLRRK